GQRPELLLGLGQREGPHQFALAGIRGGWLGAWRAGAIGAGRSRRAAAWRRVLAAEEAGGPQVGDALLDRRDDRGHVGVAMLGREEAGPPLPEIDAALQQVIEE